jgi:replicative DNA helicase
MIDITTSQEETENTLIGSLMAKPDQYLDIAGMISGHDFTVKSAHEAFNAIGKLYKAGEPVNLISLTKEMGQNYFTWLAHIELAMPVSATRLAKEIVDRGIIRRIQAGIHKLQATKIWESGDEASQALRLLYLQETVKGSNSGSMREVDARMQAQIVINRERGSIGAATGFPGLESKYVYYVPGHFWMIGGWTSTGKTALAVEKTKRLSWVGEDVTLYVSAEMTAIEIEARLLASITGIRLEKILRDMLSEAEASYISKVRKRLIEKDTVYIIDHVRTMDQLEIEVKKLKMRRGVNLVIVDFVQNLRIPGHKSKTEMFADMALRMQDLPKDCSCTLVGLSQLSNNVGREDPGQLEFKGCGEWSSACDLGAYVRRAKEDNRVIICDYRKNRHGALPEFTVKYNETWTALDDWTA